MRRLVLAALLALVAGSAAASNFVIGYQGQLRQNGIPATGTHSVVFRVYPSELSGVPVWTSAAQSVGFTAGMFFSTFTPVGVDWEGTTPVLEVEIDGTPLSPRETLAAIPYSFNAQLHAGKRYYSQAGVPAVASAGDFWFDTTGSLLKYYNGAVWVSPGSGGGSSIVSDPAQFTGDGSALTPLKLLASSVTLQGNVFNAPDSLVKLNSSGDLSVGSTIAAAGYVTLANLGATPGAARGRVFFDSTGSGAIKVSLDGATFVTLATGSVSAADTSRVLKAGDTMTGALNMSGASSFIVSGTSIATSGGFFGNGAGLTNVTGTDATRVLKTGDTMTGTLTLSGAAANVVSGSSITTSGGLFGNGSGLTALNASNVSAGTLNDLRLPATMSAKTFNGAVTMSGASAFIVSGTSITTSGGFFGNGAGLTNVTGTDATRVSKAGDSMAGALTMSGASAHIISGSSITTAGGFFGDGSALTALNASNVSAGTLNDARLPGTMTAKTFSGAITMSGASAFINSATSVTASAFFGDGSHLTGLSTTDNTKVAKTGDTMTGALTMSGASANVVSGSSITTSGGLFGSGAGITALNASNVSAGTLSDARLPGTMTAKTFSGAITMSGASAFINSGTSITASAFFGDGSGLTNLSGVDSSKVLKAGDTMTGVLTMSGSAARIVSGSSITTSGGFFGDGSGLTNVTATDATKLLKAGDAMTGALTMSGASANIVSGSSITTSGGFFGNGAGLTNVTGTDATKVAKTGDTMTGQLTLSGSTLTITGNAFSVGGSTFVVKASSVGIGTANPLAALDVTGDGATILLPRKSAAGDPPGANGMTYFNVASQKFRCYQNNAWTDCIGVSQWITNGSDIHYDAGSVGIGQAAPAQKLEIANGSIELDRLGSVTRKVYVGIGGVGGDFTTGSSGGAYIGFTQAANGLNADNELEFVTHHTGTSHAQRMKLDRDGNLALGNNFNPGAVKLHIQGSDTALTKPGVRLENTGGNGRSYQIYSSDDGSVPGPGRLVFEDLTGGGVRFSLDSSGNMAIGTGANKSTFTATGALTLASDAAMTGTSSVTASAFFGDGSHLTGISTVDNTKVAKTGDTMTGQLTLSASTLTITGNAFSVGDSTFVVAAGRVGIGTSSPAAKLHMSSGTLLLDGAGAQIKFPDGTVQATAFSGSGNDPTKVAKAGDTMTGQLTLAGSTLTVTGNGFSVGGSTFVVVAGQIGVGTTAPSTVMEVYDGTPRPTLTLHGKTGDTSGAQPRVSFVSEGSYPAYVSSYLEGVGGAAGGTNASTLNIYTHDGSALRNTAAFDGSGSLVLRGWTGQPDGASLMFESYTPNGGKTIGVGTQHGVGEAGEGLQITGGPANNLGGAAAGGPVLIHGGTGFGGGASGAVVLAHDGSAAVGRVGIGTAFPVEMLHMSSGVFLLDGTGAAIMFRDGSVQTTAFTGSGSDGTKVAKTGDTMTGQLTLSGSTLTITGNAFSVGGSTFVVTASSVGIGTNNPQAALEIAGDGATVLLPRKSAAGDPPGTNGMTYFNVADQKFRCYQNNAWTDCIGVSQWITNGSNIHYDAGSIGIGQAVPAQKIEIANGSIELDRLSSVTRKVYVGIGGAGGDFTTGSSGGAYIGFTQAANGLNADNDIEFVTHHTGVSHAQRMKLDRDGNLGVGDNLSPAAIKLHLQGVDSSRTKPGIRMENTGGNGRSYQIYSTDDGSTAGPGRLVFEDVTGGGVRLSLDGSGNVAVGSGANKSTFTATGALTLAGDAAMTGTSSVTASAFFGDGSHLTGISTLDGTKVAKTGDTMTGQLTVSGSSATIVNPAAGDSFSLAVTSATDRGVYHLYVATTGHVGFGSLSPTAQLTVRSPANGSFATSQPTVQLESDQGSNFTILRMKASSAGDARLAVNGSSDMLYVAGRHFFYDSSVAQKMLLDGSGNLIIGGGTPDQRLNVSGNVSLSGVVFSSGTGPSVFSGSLAVPNSSVTASAFFGDGSHLTGLSTLDNTKVAKTGDTMTGQLSLAGSTLSVRSSGVSPLLVATTTTGGSPALFVSGTGSVGVGTNNPQATLQLEADAPSLRMRNVTTGTNWDWVTNYNSNSYLTLLNSGNAMMQVSNVAVNIGVNGSVADFGSTRLAVEGSAAFAPLVLSTGSAASQEVLRVTPAGRLGLGTSSPQAKIDATYTSAEDGLRIKRDAGAGAVNVLSVDFNGQLLHNPTGTFAGPVASFGGGVAAATGDFFLINPAGTNSGNLLTVQKAGSTKLVVDTNGSLGIGTATPQAKLHMSSGTLLLDGAGAQLQFADGSVQTTAFTGSASDNSKVAKTGDFMSGQLTTESTITVKGDAFSVGGSTLVVVGGNVGIGTTAPGGALDVTAGPGPDIRMLVTTDFAADPYNMGLATSNGRRVVFADSLQGTYQQAMAFSDVGASGTETMFALSASNDGGSAWSPLLAVKQTGNIGVGTANPAAKLHVSSGALLLDGTNPLLGIGVAPSYPVDVIAPTGLPQIRFGYNVNKFSTLESDSGGNTHIFGTNNGNSNEIKFVNQSGGEQAIRLVSPKVYMSSATVLIDGSGAQLQFGDGSVQTTAFTGSATDASKVAKTGDFMSGQLTTESTITVKGDAFSVGVDTFVVTNGKIGIGTTSPDDGASKPHKVAIVDDAVPSPWHDDVGQLQIRGASNQNKQLTLGVNTSAAPSYAWMESGENGTSGRPLALNPDGGNVGVNTVAPTHALHVAGGILATSSITASGGFYGDGSNLTGVTATDGSKVAKTGDFMSGQLTTESTITVKGDAFSVGVDTLAVSNGRIGVGTAAPGHLLHLYKPVAGQAPARMQMQTANADGFFLTEWGYGNGKSAVMIGQNRYWDDGGNDLRGDASNPAWSMNMSTLDDSIQFVHVDAAGAKLFPMRIDGPTGKVGIGTTVPQDSLDTRGGLATSISDTQVVGKLYSSANDGVLELFTGETTPTSRVKLSAFGDSYFVPAGGGAVGIGTTSPAAGYGLDVSSAGGPAIRLSDTANQSSFRLQFGNDVSTITAAKNGAVATTILMRTQLTNGNLTDTMALKAGRVGIGTTNPGADLQVIGAGTVASPSTLNVAAPSGGSGGDAQVTLGQSPGGADLKLLMAGTDSRSDGFTANDSYMISGQRLNLFNAGNGSTYNTQIVLGDGSVNAYADIAFLAGLQNAAPSEVMRITGVGTVGIGTNNPGAALDVQGGTPGLKVGGTCVSGTCPSDRRLKKDIRYLSGSLETIAALKPAAYRYKNDPKDRLGYGLIAQDVEKVIPEAVSTRPDGMKQVDYSSLEMMLIDAVKQLKAENDELRARLEKLERSARP